MISVGVIGYGYWGPNLVRNFAEVQGCRVAAVADLRPERLSIVQARYPAVRCLTDYRDMIGNPEIDAVVIATPVSTHAPIAMEALSAGKHVLVEKPLSATADEAARLIDLAAKRQLVLMVDHTFVYTSAVRKIRELVERGELGQIYYYDSVRINLGQFQSDVNVVWDLAVHDLSILDDVLGKLPVAVSATGLAHFKGEPENIAYLTLFFDEPLIAHLHVNWLAPVKVRRTVIGGSRRMVVFDDLEASEKIKIYDRGVSVAESTDPRRVYDMLIGYRMGDMWAPQLDVTEALQTEAQHFVECVRDRRKPITDGEAGLRIVRILEAATQSLRQQGRLTSVAAEAGAR